MIGKFANSFIAQTFERIEPLVKCTLCIKNSITNSEQCKYSSFFSKSSLDSSSRNTKKNYFGNIQTQMVWNLMNAIKL